MSSMQSNMKEMVEIRVLIGDGVNKGVRTFVVAKESDIRLVGSSIMVMEGAQVKLLVPAVSVQSILPVVTGNQVSAREFKDGKQLAEGQIVILGIGTSI